MCMNGCSDEYQESGKISNADLRDVANAVYRFQICGTVRAAIPWRN